MYEVARGYSLEDHLPHRDSLALLQRLPLVLSLQHLANDFHLARWEQRCIRAHGYSSRRQCDSITQSSSLEALQRMSYLGLREFARLRPFLYYTEERFFNGECSGSHTRISRFNACHWHRTRPRPMYRNSERRQGELFAFRLHSHRY